jgi:hypothetical protein
VSIKEIILLTISDRQGKIFQINRSAGKQNLQNIFDKHCLLARFLHRTTRLVRNIKSEEILKILNSISVSSPGPDPSTMPKRSLKISDETVPFGVYQKYVN